MENLNFIIQAQDHITWQTLSRLGFQALPQIPLLQYKTINKSQLFCFFKQLAHHLSQAEQAVCRFLITPLALDCPDLLLEFLKANPLIDIINCVSKGWFFRLLINKKIFFHYQPIFDLKSHQIVAHECLVRAQSEQGKLITGKKLIDTAIETQLATEFDYLARTKCLHNLAQLKSKQKFFINVLPNALVNDCSSFQENIEQISHLGIKPQQIVFELTEAQKISSNPKLPQVVKQLQDQGFGIALDDLGSFVSMQNYCLEFRPDILKIDRQIVHGCAQYPMKQIVLKSLLESAHQMGGLVVAEGLETVEDIQLCRNIGVDMGQGFALARPSLALQQQPFNFAKPTIKLAC